MFNQVPPDYSLEAWVQDLFLVREEKADGRICLLENSSKGQARDNRLNKQIAGVISDQFDYKLCGFDQKIVGGDILCGGGYLLCGNDTLNGRQTSGSRANHSARMRQEQFLCREFGVERVFWIDQILEDRLLGCPVRWNENLWKELGHIDLILSLGGPLPDDSNLHLIFVAEITREHCYPEAAFESQKVQNQRMMLDEVAAGLARQFCGEIGFKIERLPLFVDASSGRPIYKSFNNCLIEVDASGRRATVPVYGEKLDSAHRENYIRAEQAMQRAFESCGFDVHPVAGGFPADIGSDGSLRCAVNILEREK